MKRALKYFALGLLSVGVLGLVTVSVLLWFPETVVNATNLKRIMGETAQWEHGELQAKSTSMWEKSLNAKFTNFCLRKEVVKGCFRKVNLGVKLSLKNFNVLILEIDPAVLTSDSVEIDLSLPSQEEEDEGPSLLSYFDKKLQINQIDIQLKDLSIKTADEKYHVKLSLEDRKADDKLSGKLLLKAFAEKDKTFKVDAKLNLQSSTMDLKGPFVLSGPLDIKSGDIELNTMTYYKYNQAQDSQYNIDVDLKNPSVNFSGKILGKLESRGLKGGIRGQGIVEGLNFKFNKLAPCDYQLSNDFTKVTLDCPFQFTSSRPGRVVKDAFDFVKFNITANVEEKKADRWTGFAGVKILPIEEKSLLINASVGTHLKDTSFDWNSLKRLSVKIEALLDILDFQKFVRLLKPTPYDIPAPFNVLSGKLKCQVDGEINLKGKSLPIKCTSDLKAENQSFQTNLDAELEFKSEKNSIVPHLKAAYVLDDVQFVLPNFGISGPPALVPDARIKKTLKKKPLKSPTFKYDLSLKTQKPLRLVSNLAQAPIPMDLDLRLQEVGPAKGRIFLKEFPVTLFKRKAVISYFKVTLAKDPLVDGLVNVAYSNYKIRIFVRGTAKEPQLQMESDPPLPENEIISVLLFGRTSNELSPDQTSSVSNTKAAVTDKAIALSSMYLLASTPVESVGYNPQGKVFSAKVRLQEGTSLVVGADREKLRQVGINKHLGGPWYIYTYARSESEDEDWSTTALLEWVTRY